MSADSERVIFYTYHLSPMWMKIRNCLILKRIPYSLVLVPQMPPRPQLSSLLNITYRRIPILAIGNDLYFDTSLMIQVIESRFPASKGYPALLSPHGGLQETISAHWSDRIVWPITSALFPRNARLPEAFLKDRGEFRGIPIMDLEAMDKGRPATLSKLRVHLAFISDQLVTSSTPFLLGTPTPTYLDVSLYTVLAWGQAFKTANSVFSDPSYARIASWMKAVASTLDVEMEKPTILEAEEAASIIYRSLPIEAPLFDKKEPIVVAGWVRHGGLVIVTPDDTGKVPQVGELVGISDKTVTLKVPSPNKEAYLLAHFPRVGYTVEAWREKKAAKL